MHTFSGIDIRLKKHGVPTPLDFAVQMGRVCRFGGAHWWTLTPHSILVSQILETSLKQVNEATVLWGLMHDAHEVVTGDILFDFKPPEVKKVQQAIDKLIRPAYQFAARDIDFDMVHWADQMALLTEKDYFVEDTSYLKYWDGYEVWFDQFRGKFRELIDNLATSDWCDPVCLVSVDSWTTQVMRTVFGMLKVGAHSAARSILLRETMPTGWKVQA